MGIRATSSIESILDKVKKGEKLTKYQFKRYKTYIQAKDKQKEVKKEFEEFLKEESAKYSLGYNPYQE